MQVVTARYSTILRTRCPYESSAFISTCKDTWNCRGYYRSYVYIHKHYMGLVLLFGTAYSLQLKKLSPLNDAKARFQKRKEKEKGEKVR